MAEKDSEGSSQIRNSGNISHSTSPFEGDAQQKNKAGPAVEESRSKQAISEEAEKIAQLLTLSPDLINITVNVGFNTKVSRRIFSLWSFAVGGSTSI
jgi:hypothetical protein